MKKVLINPVGMLLAGLVLGAVSRLLDIYTQNLGSIFSQMAIWILLGTLIAVYSDSPKLAMANILPFCLGMLATYYAVAVLTKGVYGKWFIIGWTVFALCSPVLAFFTWWTKERGVVPKLISVGIVLASVLSSVLLFDGFRIYDAVIHGLLVYVLLFMRIERGRRSRNDEDES